MSLTTSKVADVVGALGVERAIAKLLRRNKPTDVRQAMHAWVATITGVRTRARERAVVDRLFPLRRHIRRAPVRVAAKDRAAIVVRHIARHGDSVSVQETTIDGEPAIVLRKAEE